MTAPLHKACLAALLALLAAGCAGPANSFKKKVGATLAKQDFASAPPLDELVLRNLTLQTPLSFMSNHPEHQLVPGRPGKVINTGGAGHAGP